MLYNRLLVLVLCSSLLASCALRRSTKGLTDYEQGIVHYEAKDYHEAAQLFKKALPILRGKREEASVHFYQAYCSFYQKKYVRSADRFKYFHETFLRDPRAEEALYMQGRALYLESPDVVLDQSITEEAVCALRNYVDRYPEGTYIDQAATHLKELDNKLALKAFNNAKHYHQLDRYAAAVVALGYFQEDFPDTPHSQEAAYLKAEAQHRRPVPKDEATQRAQCMTTIKCCQEFLDAYPDSKYASAIEKIYEESLARIDKLAQPLKRPSP
ncbi:MAG: outer membrane protein assembly factor BamD [Roseivirga sp.]